MKFRTEIELAPCGVKIGYQNRMLALGSCFAEHIAGRLSAAKFAVCANPSGILFNPLSIAAALSSYASQTPVTDDELHTDDERWFHYGFHGDFAATTAKQALSAMNAARKSGAEALRTSDRILLTFGTAWVYERDGEVVANCHKQPSAEFTRRRLSVSEIVEIYDQLLTGPLFGKEILLTISPIRHLGDGLEGNSVSKSVLRLAAAELTEKHPNVHYFPAYELLLDDLRDYRFYADDLVHPAPQAIAYVWEKFSSSVLCVEAQQRLGEIEAIVMAASHRPRNPQGEAYKSFCATQLRKIAAMPEVDFHTEEAFFRRCIEKNP